MACRKISCRNDEGQEQTFMYEMQGTGAVLAAYLTSDVSAVVIPPEIEGKPVIAVGNRCFINHSEIEAIRFPSTLTRIGDSAFAMCKGLRELILPDLVQEIGPYAFRDCRGLQKVVLPAKLKVLRFGTFAFCSLWNVDMRLPEGLEIIETHAFYGAGLFDLVIPNSVREIQPDAFEHLGPHPITSLPHDRRWYPRWPLGEKVTDERGRTGLVSNVRHLQDRGICCLLTIAFDGEKTERFYPCGMEGLTFVTEISRRTLAEDLASAPEARDLYQNWLNGLV